MPIYEFYCKPCDRIAEKLCSMYHDADDNQHECYKCNGIMHRVISASVGKVQGGTGKLTTCLTDKNVSKPSK